jgi:hypothetical protein
MKYHGLLRATPRGVLNGKPKIKKYIILFFYACFTCSKGVLNKMSKYLFSPKNTISIYL